MSLTQPWATVIAGGLAVTAASLALEGVLLNIQYQRHAARRDRAIEQLFEAVGAIEAVTNIMIVVRAAHSPKVAEVSNLKALESIERIGVVLGRLSLLGLSDASKATKSFMDLFMAESQQASPNFTREEIVTARKSAVAKLAEARQLVETSERGTFWRRIRDAITPGRPMGHIPPA